MAIHWVNYDLHKSGQDYGNLITYLKSHQSWAKPLKSSFFVKTGLTAKQLRDEIKKRIDANDDVVVVTVTGSDWATYGLSAEVNEWLRNNRLFRKWSAGDGEVDPVSGVVSLR